MRRPHNTAIWKAVVAEAARTVFVNAWAQYKEERGETKGFSGRNLDDLAPKKTPAKATAWAKDLIKKFEDMNGETIEKVFGEISVFGGTPKEFGYCLAMESLGSGVGWADDHDEHGRLVPHSEFIMHAPGDFTGYVSADKGLASMG